MHYETRFQKLQEHAQEAWTFLAGFSHEALNRAPAPGQWSALQQMLHINKSERSFVILLTRSLQGGKPLNGKPLPLLFRRWFYYARIRFGARLKAPKVADTTEETDLQRETVQRDFEKTRAQLKALLDGMKPEQRNSYWVVHPFLKEMRTDDLLEFLQVHQAHHTRKMYRMLKTGAGKAA